MAEGAMEENKARKGDELNIEVQSGVGRQDLAEKKIPEQRSKVVERTGCEYLQEKHSRQQK